MKLKKSLITIAGCAAMLGSSFVYAENESWNGKQSNKNTQSLVGMPTGPGPAPGPGQAPGGPMMEKNLEFLQTLELSKAQKNEIAKLRASNMKGNEKIMQTLKSCSAQLRKLMMNPGASQSEVNKQIDACAMAKADLQKSKAKVRHIIYTQILSKEQQKVVMDELKARMANPHPRFGGPKGMMHHGHGAMQKPIPMQAQPAAQPQAEPMADSAGS